MFLHQAGVRKGFSEQWVQDPSWTEEMSSVQPVGNDSDRFLLQEKEYCSRYCVPFARTVRYPDEEIIRPVQTLYPDPEKTGHWCSCPACLRSRTEVHRPVVGPRNLVTPIGVPDRPPFSGSRVQSAKVFSFGFTQYTSTSLVVSVERYIPSVISYFRSLPS